MSLMHHVRQMMMPQPEGDVAVSEEDVERIAALIYPRRTWAYYWKLLGPENPVSTPTATTNPAYPDRMSYATIDLTATLMRARAILIAAGVDADEATELVVEASLDGMPAEKIVRRAAGVAEQGGRS